jgi:hypothetical protein
MIGSVLRAEDDRMVVPHRRRPAMAKYLLLKYYRGGPAPAGGNLIGATPEEMQAHQDHMSTLNDELRERGEFVDAQGLAPTGLWVRGGADASPVTDGPFAETKDLIAGFWIVDVESEARAYEIAARGSAAPGIGGEPVNDWIEVRPVLSAAPATFDELFDQL